MLHDQRLDDIVCRKLSLAPPAADLSAWNKLIFALEHPQREVNIALVGKYVDLTESYKSLSEALIHAGIHTGARVKIHYVDSENIEKNGTGVLASMDAILVPGGFGKRGVEGKIRAIRYARDVAGLDGAHSTEFDPDTPHPVIALITEWQDRDGRIEQRDANSDLGGTMRLGGQECLLKPGSQVREIYGADRIVERHRHRYEVNNHYLPRIERAGLRVSGVSTQQDGLCEMIELPGHPWFIGCQFHPEFTSTPRGGHPLFNAFIRAAARNAEATAGKTAAEPKLKNIA